MADAIVSNTIVLTGVWVRLPPPAQQAPIVVLFCCQIIGIASRKIGMLSQETANL